MNIALDRRSSQITLKHGPTYEAFYRPLVKSMYQKINFLISQPKQMLWVLIRTVSMRRFF